MCCSELIMAGEDDDDDDGLVEWWRAPQGIGLIGTWAAPSPCWAWRNVNESTPVSVSHHRHWDYSVDVKCIDAMTQETLPRRITQRLAVCHKQKDNVQVVSIVQIAEKSCSGNGSVITQRAEVYKSLNALSFSSARERDKLRRHWVFVAFLISFLLLLDVSPLIIVWVSSSVSPKSHQRWGALHYNLFLRVLPWMLLIFPARLRKRKRTKRRGKLVFCLYTRTGVPLFLPFY